MSLGVCDHCPEPSVVGVNGTRGCLDHLDDTMRTALSHTALTIIARRIAEETT